MTAQGHLRDIDGEEWGGASPPRRLAVSGGAETLGLALRRWAVLEEDLANTAVAEERVGTKAKKARKAVGTAVVDWVSLRAAALTKFSRELEAMCKAMNAELSNIEAALLKAIPVKDDAFIAVVQKRLELGRAWAGRRVGAQGAADKDHDYV